MPVNIGPPPRASAVTIDLPPAAPTLGNSVDVPAESPLVQHRPVVADVPITTAFDLPSLPVLGAPSPGPLTTPTSPTMPDLSASEPALAGPFDSLAVDPESAPEVPSAKRTSNIPVGLLLALFVAVIVAVGAFFVLGGDSSDGDSATNAPEPRAGVELADPGSTEGEAALDPSTNPIIQTFDEAEAVVGDINENDAEIELLEDLGLDETGNPAAANPFTFAGYDFRWDDPSGQGLDVTVDLTAGDYEVTASDGIAFRFVDGTYFGRPTADAEWYELPSDPFESIPVIGLDGPPSLADVMPESALAHSTSAETASTSIAVYTVDDTAFAAADRTARDAWLIPWGLVVDDVSATPITVTVTIDLDTDHLTSVRFDAVELGGFAEFTVVSTSADAPVIESPLG